MGGEERLRLPGCTGLKGAGEREEAGVCSVMECKVQVHFELPLLDIALANSTAFLTLPLRWRLCNYTVSAAWASAHFRVADLVSRLEDAQLSPTHFQASK
jgi:hypothetical protein